MTTITTSDKAETVRQIVTEKARLASTAECFDMYDGSVLVILETVVGNTCFWLVAEDLKLPEDKLVELVRVIGIDTFSNVARECRKKGILLSCGGNPDLQGGLFSQDGEVTT